MAALGYELAGDALIGEETGWDLTAHQNEVVEPVKGLQYLLGEVGESLHLGIAGPAVDPCGESGGE